MSARRLPRPKLIHGILLLLACAGGALRLGAQESITNCTSSGNLADAISRTNYIVFACAGTISVTNEILVSGDVTIDAGDQNITLNANNARRIFTVLPGAKLTLINLTLTGGKAPRGGAVHNEGELVATNCVFAGNNAPGPNGAAGANGKDDNTTPTDGGNGVPGSDGFGGAIWNISAMTLARCTFATNSATGGNGGAGGKGGDAVNGAFNSGDGGDGAPGGIARGGAIYTAGSEVSIFECVFHKNTITGGNGGAFGAAGTGGLAGKTGQGGQGGRATGAALFNGASVTIDSCTFSDNRADGGDSGATGGESSNGNGNNGLAGGEAWGGAVCNINTANVTNSTFSTNRVFAGDGGKGADGSLRGGRGGDGGTAFGGNFYNNASSTLRNCTIAGGSALGGTNGVGGTGSIAGSAGVPGANRGGNLAGVGGSLEIRNTIVCRGGTGANGFGAIFDGGYNISSDNSISMGGGSRVNVQPRIGGLGDNDGFGRTFALNPESPAIDYGDPGDSLEVDQRGFPMFGVARDSGAYEFAASSITVNVTDIDGHGVGGVEVVVSGVATNSTTTNGVWVFDPFPAGDYTVTPSHPLYSFDPPSETVTLGPAVSLSFTAVRTFSVSGFVRDGTNGINSVTVSIGGKQGITDTNGFYQVSGLDAGSYTAQPTSAGYAFSPSLQQVGVQGDTTNVNFTAVGMFSISGRIRNDSGQPLADVVVRAGNRSAVTGPTGDYTITQLPSRSQVVTPSFSGYSFNPPSLTLIPQTDENGIDFAGFASYQVSGVVLNASNSLGANAVTLTLRTNAATGASVVALSDTNGFFAFTNLRAGSYVLTPAKAGFAFQPVTNLLTLGPSVTNLTNYMYPAFSMAGRVTAAGVGLSNVTITVRTNGDTEIARATNSATGNYSFNNLPAGTYELVPSLAGYDFTPTNRIVILTNAVNNLDFASTGVFSIRGQVTKNGNPLANVTVRCSGAVSVTDSTGAYALTNLPPGTYTVTADDPFSSFQPASAFLTVGPSRTGVDFTAVDVYTINGEVLEGAVPLVGARVTAGGVTNFTTAQGRYTLPRVPAGSVVVAASMSGYEFAPAQQSFVLAGLTNGVNFSARGLSAISGRVIDAVTSNGIASVKITVAGRYETNTSSTGFYVLTNVGPGVHTVVPSRTNRGFTPISRQVTVLTNSVSTNIDFVTFRASKLFGRIVDEATNAIANVSVRVEGSFGTNTVTTDTNGNYVFPALRNGSYKVTPSKAGLGFNPHFFDVDLTADAQRDFLAFPGFTIRGVITDGASPVVGIQVNVNTPDIDFTVTDATGSYVLDGLPEGDYNVSPIGIGYDVTPATRQLTLGPTNAFNVNFTAHPNLAVSGRVLEGSVGISNIQVRLTSTNTPPFSRAVNTDTSGTFLFTNLPPGNVTIQPTSSDLFSPANYVLNPLSYPAPNFTANPPKLGVSRAVNGINITLRGLPGRQYTIQTNSNASGTWNTLPPTRLTDTNGNVQFFHTNILSGRAMFFRARR